MKILGYNFGTKEQLTWAEQAKSAVLEYKKEREQATYQGQPYPVVETYFDGEKTQGELWRAAVIFARL